MESAIPEYILESVHSLPPLPAAVQRLMTLIKDPDTDFDTIAEVIETDQALTARMLRAANSPLYGVSRRIQTVRQATVLLGRDAIMSMAIGASVMSLQQTKANLPTDPVIFWRHNMAVATAARALAKHLRLADPEEAFVAGLLHDIGKLILINHFDDVYVQVLMAAQYGTKPLHQLEREVLDTDHAVVGHALCLHWNLPAVLTRAVADHHEEAVAPTPNSVSDLVRNANDLAKMIHQGNSGNRYAELRPSQFLPHNQIRPDDLDDLLRALPKMIREAEAVFAGTSEDELATVFEPTSRPLVHLEVTVREEREMLKFLLSYRGFEPVVLQDAADRPASEAPLAGLITDLPLTPARQVAYQRYNAPILNFAAWRSENSQPTHDRHFNVHALKKWVDQHLVHPESKKGKAAIGQAA